MFTAMNLRTGVLLTLACLGFGVSAGTRVTNFGSNPGNLAMYRTIPSQPQAVMPLVVLLHGCTQDAAGFENETGWIQLAEQWGFALVSAEQNSGNNQTSCFNWFENGDITRGFGETLSIKQMVDKMKADFPIDPNRVYVVGFSAGGAMAAVALATYPDVFTGGAIFAGVPYRCDTGLNGAFSCMNPGKDLSPTQWGNLVRNASSHNGPWPVVSIWHGDGDFTVRPNNSDELAEQWTNVHGIDAIADINDTVRGYPHQVWTDSAGNPLVERYTITGMGHAVPVDPGPGDNQGGSTGGFSQDRDIFAAYHVARFLGLDNSDGAAPVVSLTSPQDGATVNGQVSLTATASDNIGVVAVSFFVDGQLLATDSSSPFQATWDTANAANGNHSLSARAFDNAGNTGVSMPVDVIVTGGIEDITPPEVALTFPGDGTTVNGTVTFTASATDDFGVTEVEFFVDGQSVGTGLPSGQAGPWALIWNSTSVNEGVHTVQVRAYDANGNEGSDGPVQITVDQDVLALNETFSDRDGNGDAPNADTSGWQGSWTAATDNHTMGPAASGSLRGRASSGLSCAVGVQLQKVEIELTLGDNPQLSYQRKLQLNAQINFATYAAFRVLVDGSVVDQQTATFANTTENQWTERNLDLGAFAGERVDLTFEVEAFSNVCLEASAEAWIDDITVGNGTRSEDITPPSVNLTAPANGATLTGSVDLTASATDDVAVGKVEFYSNGDLLGVVTEEPYLVTWDTTLVADGTYDLSVRAYDGAGNTAADADTTVTVSNSGGGSPTTMVFANLDSQDGYVKANENGSGLAIGSGFMESYFGLALGRGSDGKHNRTVLSFDTSNIPDGATINCAFLTVTRNSSSGDPWAGGNRLEIDIQDGCLGACGIETSDWGASTSQAQVAQLLAWGTGDQSSTDFTASGLSAINVSGQTQLKLYFSDFQTQTAYLFIDNGANATLTVTWQ